MAVHNPTAFLEKLLELEWPDRRACVAPAPFDPVEAAPLDDPRSFYVLVVTVGPSPGDPAFVHFRLETVAGLLQRHDWPGAAAVLLVTARAKFHEFRLAAQARKVP